MSVAYRQQLDAALLELQSRWDRALSLLRSQAKSDVAEWSASLDRLVLAQRRLIADGLWTRGPSDLLAVLGVHHDEVRNCRVLRWLFDPMGPHGLGTHFLGWFLDAVGTSVPPEDLALVSVEAEVVAGRTRADLVLSGPRFTVVVEAKMNAPEAPRQCHNIEAAWADQDPSLVFLTRSGRPPRTGHPAAWTSISWRDVGAGLERSLVERPAAGPGRLAAEEYLRSLRSYT